MAAGHGSVDSLRDQPHGASSGRPRVTAVIYLQGNKCASSTCGQASVVFVRTTFFRVGNCTDTSDISGAVSSAVGSFSVCGFQSDQITSHLLVQISNLRCLTSNAGITVFPSLLI
eukprot:766859-Hanusia_phi.AAC.2